MPFTGQRVFKRLIIGLGVQMVLVMKVCCDFDVGTMNLTFVALFSLQHFAGMYKMGGCHNQNSQSSKKSEHCRSCQAYLITLATWLVIRRIRSSA